MQYQSELDLAIAASRLAGAYLNEARTRFKTVLSAEGRDIKLEADRKAEEIILETIRACSVYPILTEERGIDKGTDLDEGWFWIVDPLDGTLNFSRGLRLGCVSIGLWQGIEPVLGVVYDFYNDELFAGVVEEGAWCNGDVISVSDVTSAQEAILATGFPVNRDFESGSLGVFLQQVQRFKKVRLLGTAALSLAYVASGRVDVYAEEGIMWWDVAAGIALVRAAGGCVRVCDSSRTVEWAMDVRGVANPAIWDDIDDLVPSGAVWGSAL